MRIMTREEFKAFNLEILDEINDFCRKNGINYSIAYGTLLGAVRHKGFIPWDDDIDIMMLRPDYERFRRMFKSEKFFFVDCQTIPDCYISFGRVCDNKRTKTISYIPWHGSSCETGLWVDVFPLDKVSDDKDEFSSLFFSLHSQHKLATRCRKIHAEFKDCFTLKSKLKLLFDKNTNPNIMKLDPVDFVRSRQEIIRLSSLQDTHSYSQISCTEYKSPEVLDAADLQSYSEYEFEGRKYMGWTNYDPILRTMYGNYMELPPKEKRKPLQNYIRFCWK